MTNILKALKWRMCGSYDPNGPVREGNSVRAQNRAKYEVWKYNTFGPGRGVFGSERAYEFVDAQELCHGPLHINDPHWLAGMSSIIAEMEGNRHIAIRTPLGAMLTPREVTRQEEDAINRVVGYLVPEDLPPQQYVAEHEDTGRTSMISTPIQEVTVLRVIEPDIPKSRENLGRIFREMLEKLKEHHSGNVYEKARI